MKRRALISPNTNQPSPEDAVLVALRQLSNKALTNGCEDGYHSSLIFAALTTASTFV